jgi:hypothetical protein
MKGKQTIYGASQTTIIFLKIVVFTGNSLTFLGFLGLLLGFIGLVEMNLLSFGLSSGVRVIGTVAIAGCLLSAVGYSFLDILNK